MSKHNQPKKFKEIDEEYEMNSKKGKTTQPQKAKKNKPWADKQKDKLFDEEE